MLWISKWTGPSYCLSRDFNSLVATSSMSRHRSHVATSTLVYAALNWLFLMSRHQSLVATSAQVFCRLQLVAHDVATSAQVFCSLQLVVHDVATSISCRDINLCLCSFTGCFWCRDFSPLSRQQLELHQLHLSKPVIASRRFSCRDLHPLSRHQPLSRHHDAVATSFL